MSIPVGLPLAMREAVEIAAQVAEALAAAHARGVVHRDVKPENVMVHRDGYVKVLDFGLAKLLEPSAKADTKAPTRPMVNTGAGMVMGTVNYMSPEQARGLEVDERTDIWSFGVVLYEMVTGRAPFEGTTPSDVIAKILEREPPAIARFTREAPEALEYIVSKALARRLDERYQTARELLADLKKLSRRLELDVEIERSSPLNSSASPTDSPPIDTEPEGAAGVRAVMQTAGVGAARTTSSAEYLITGIRRHKWGVTIICALLAVTLAGIGYGVYRLAGQKHPELSFLAPAAKRESLERDFTRSVDW